MLTQERRRMRIGRSSGPRTISTENIDKTFKDVKQIETITTLILIFPDKYYDKVKQFPLDSVDFSPLATLENLEEISIQSLWTDSLLPILKHTKNLRYIEIYFGGPITKKLIEDMEVAESLEHLVFSTPTATTANDLLHIGKFRELTKLRIEVRKIDYVDFSFLRTLTKLQEFEFRVDLSPTAPLSDNDEKKEFPLPTGLRKLKVFGDNTTHDIVSSSKLHHLEDVDLSSTNLTSIDLDIFAESPVTTLNLGKNSMQNIDLSPLSNYYNLQYLSLNNNKLEQLELSPVSECKLLHTLDLKTNHLKAVDLTPLSQCSHLHTLDLNDNHLTRIDLTPLSQCSHLRILHLKTNRLKTVDLTPLSQCSRLQYLDLSFNQLTRIDLTPLSGCPTILKIDLEGNPLKTLDSVIIPPDLDMVNLPLKLEIERKQLSKVEIREM